MPTARLPIVLAINATELVPHFIQPVPTATDLAVRVGCPHDIVGLRAWHDPATWPDGIIPSNGSSVTIPVGAPVLISSCSIAASDIYTTITVPANATLILADANITLAVGAINVVGGALLAGNVSCRLRSVVNITLVGSRPGGPTMQGLQSIQQSPPANAKGILVSGIGVLELHGTQYAPTWTRLSSPAIVGDTWLYVQDAVNWEPGQTIVVLTSALKDSRDYTESEERVLRAVYSVPVAGGGANVTALQLDRPLQHAHYAGTEYQAEVALMSRRLVVSGSIVDSPPIDATPVSCPGNGFSSVPCGNTSLTGYGGHVMVMGSGATGRISGVLLLRMGQTNTMGRYAMHFHLVNDSGYRSFVQVSSAAVSLRTSSCAA